MTVIDDRPHGSRPARLERSPWGVAIPWFMTVNSLAVLLCLAWFLIENIFWFREQAFPPGVARSPAFTLFSFHLHLAMVTRSVGLFSGFALIFIGTAVAFYTLRHQTVLDGEASGLRAKLATTSPGIVAMVVGALLITFTISSKNEFEPIPVDTPAERLAAPLQQPAIGPG